MVHDKLKKMLGKKRDLSHTEKAAKMDVINQLKDAASEAMGHKLNKVSVMSDSKQGLSKGLDKAKEIVSGSQMDAMKNHAENPYGDYKSAMDEHASDEDNTEAMANGGMAGYAEGGEVEGQEETPDKGEYEAQDQGSPAEEEEESPEHEGAETPEEEAAEHEPMDEFHGLDIKELQRRLRELTKKHK